MNHLFSSKKFAWPVMAVAAAITATTLLSSCMNIFGFVDKPSGDDQILSAARSCLDREQYDCAKTYYEQLSNNDNDVKIAELALTGLAQDHIFSISDIISNLGAGSGSSLTLRSVAEAMGARGATTLADREEISTIYRSASGIINPSLQAFVQFVTSFSMFNSVLATAITNHQLAETDIVQSAACTPLDCTSGTGQTDCQIGAGTALGDYNNNSVDMSNPTSWDQNTLDNLIAAADAMSTAVATLKGTSTGSSGLFDKITQVQTALAPIISLPQAKPIISGCLRQALLKTIFDK